MSAIAKGFPVYRPRYEMGLTSGSKPPASEADEAAKMAIERKMMDYFGSNFAGFCIWDSAYCTWEPARREDMVSFHPARTAIVKGFPKGYILHTSGLQRVTLPCKGWLVVEHYGLTHDGLEFFIIVGRTRVYPTRREAIGYLKMLRADGITD